MGILGTITSILANDGTPGDSRDDLILREEIAGLSATKADARDAREHRASLVMWTYNTAPLTLSIEILEQL